MKGKLFVLIFVALLSITACNEETISESSVVVEKLKDKLLIVSEENIILEEQISVLESNLAEAINRLEVAETEINLIKIREIPHQIGFLNDDLIGYIDQVYYYVRINRKNIDKINGYENFDGYLGEVNTGSSKITFDIVDFLGFGDEIRLLELGYDPDKDLPSAFLIHNPSDELKTFNTTDETKYYTLNLSLDNPNVEITLDEFILLSKEYDRFYSIKIFKGDVLEIYETYLP